jgi:hypothetical protein
VARYPTALHPASDIIDGFYYFGKNKASYRGTGHLNKLLTYLFSEWDIRILRYAQNDMNLVLLEQDGGRGMGF